MHPSTASHREAPAPHTNCRPAARQPLASEQERTQDKGRKEARKTGSHQSAPAHTHTLPSSAAEAWRYSTRRVAPPKLDETAQASHQQAPQGPQRRRQAAAGRYSTRRAAVRGKATQAPRARNTVHCKSKAKAAGSERQQKGQRTTQPHTPTNTTGARVTHERCTGSKPAEQHSKSKGAQAKAGLRARSSARSHTAPGSKAGGGEAPHSQQGQRNRVGRAREQTAKPPKRPLQPPETSPTQHTTPPTKNGQSEARAKQHTSSQPAAGPPRQQALRRP